MIAFETAEGIKSAFVSGLPVLAVDVPPAVFDAMTRSIGWITDDEAWRGILALFPTQHSAYANQVRDAAQKRKVDAAALGYVLLFAVRVERMQLLCLN